MLYILNSNNYYYIYNNYIFHKNLFHIVRHTILINLQSFDEIYYAELVILPILIVLVLNITILGD